MHLRAIPGILAACVLIGCAPQTRIVCVLDYEIIAPGSEYQYLARAIPEFLTNELAKTARMRVQDPQDVDRFISNREQRWVIRSPARLKRLGRSPGSDYFILGSVTRLGDNFVIESRLFSVERGHVVPGTAVREICRSEREILARVRLIADRMRYQVLARSPTAAGSAPPG